MATKKLKDGNKVAGKKLGDKDSASFKRKMGCFGTGKDLTAWTWSHEAGALLVTDNDGVPRFMFCPCDDTKPDAWEIIPVHHASQLNMHRRNKVKGVAKWLDSFTTRSTEFIGMVCELWKNDSPAALGLLWRQSRILNDREISPRTIPSWAR